MVFLVVIIYGGGFEDFSKKLDERRKIKNNWQKIAIYFVI